MRALLLLVVLLLLPVQALGAVQRFALIVGNNQGHAPDLALRYAESDASRVAQVLRDLGDFEPADTVLLRGEDATTVRRSLVSLNDRIRAAQSVPGQQALLFVYYSGHADAQALRLGSSRFDFKELSQLVRGSSATFRLLVVDACRSGVVTRLKGAKVVAPFDLGVQQTLPGEGMAFLTASTDQEDAQESDEIRGSFFTNALVSGLMGTADADRDGSVVLEEAYRHARDATVRATSRTFAGPQHPSFQYELRGQDSLVLTRVGVAAKTRAQLVFPLGIGFLVMAGDSSGAVVGEVEANAALPRLSVRPGRYFLRGRAADYLLEGQVDVAAGTEHRVQSDQLTRVAFARLVRKGAGARRLAHSFEAGLMARGQLPSTDGPCFGPALGYVLALEPLSLGARLGGCRGSFENSSLSATTDEYTAVAQLRKVWDFSWGSPFVGFGVGAALTHQRFDSRGSAPSRTSFSPLAAPLAGVSLPLTERAFVALELAAELQLIRFQPSAHQDDALESAFAPRALLSAGFQL